jgi:flagellar hook-associated protein 2
VASPIIFSGLASGIDSEALISALTNQAKVPMNKLEKQKTEFNAQSKKVSDIKTKLTALQTAARALDSKSETLGNKSSSSDEKVLKTQATGGVSMGTFKVEVTSIAQAERTYGAGFASSTEAGVAGAGTLTIQVGAGEAFQVEVTSSDTLESIARKINASGADVSAGLIKEGGNYRLQVTGKKTGAENGVTFTESSGLAIGLQNGEEKQAASDAVVVIDGYEVTSATNAVTNAVPGVTLNVVDKGTTVVQTERDPESLKTKLGAFVTAYNDVMKTLNAEFASVGGLTKGRESLGADSTMRSLQSTLRSYVSSTTENGASTVTSLGAFGVSVQRDGTLTLDDAKFTKAVSSDYEGIASALAGLTDGTGLMSKLADGLDAFTRSDGALKNKIDNLASRNRRIDTQLSSMQTRLDKYEATLRTQYAALESTIGRLQSQGNALSGIISSY